MKVFENNFFMLKHMWKASPKWVFMSIFSSVFGYITSVIYTLFLFPFIVEALEGKRQFIDVIIFLVIYMVLNMLAGVIFSWNRHVLELRESVVVREYFTKMVYNQAVRVDLSCYEDPEFYDNYTKANEELMSRASYVLGNISWICGIVLSMMASVAAIVMYEPMIFFVIVLPTMLVRFVDKRYTKYKYDRNTAIIRYDRQMEYVKRIVYLQDYAKDLRLSNIFGPIINNFHNALDTMVDIMHEYNIKIALYRFIREIFMGFIIFLAVQGIIVFKFILYSAYSLSGFTRVLNAASNLSDAMGALSWARTGFYENGMYINNLRQFLEYEPKMVENPDGKDPSKAKHDITIINLSFTYQGANEPVINDISMNIPAGQKIALVGHNGAGKSTFVKLLMRLYDTTGGSIELDGIDIKEYKLSEYRHIFGTIFQDFKIFAMSVTENVILHEVASEDDVERAKEALKASGIYDKIEKLDNGMNSLLTKEFSDNGVIMSGGEFQKLAIARVFAKESSIAILDEPSSALDPISEYEMFDSMMKACKDKTVIFVSHRLSSAVLADKIYMLENGRVIEEGSHSELMEANGKYAEMFRMQAEKYRQEEAFV